METYIYTIYICSGINAVLIYLSMAHSKNAFNTLCSCVYECIKSSYVVPVSQVSTTKIDPESPESPGISDNN